MLNYGAPIASVDATMCVSGEATPYIGMECHWIPLRAFAKCPVEFEFLATVLRICLAMAAGALMAQKEI